LQQGESELSPLTTAIVERDALANQLAGRMGQAAMSDLMAMLNDANSTTRTLTVSAAGYIDLAISHELVFKALDDEDINVVHAAVAVIEKQQAKVSTALLNGLLDKLTNPETKNRIILLLGHRLTLNEAGLVDKYCTVEQAQSIALHSMAVLAKIGVEQRQQQFSAYLLSIKGNAVAFNDIFMLIKYINQPWLVPSIRLLLSNKENVQYLSVNLPGYPSVLRVCDKAVSLIATLLKVEFSFKAHRHANFTDEQLAEVNLITSNYHY
tara:strand:+ start:24980 stop:25777 length:798 start_codon:yes stop_codon:yes gene_type:complete